MDDIPLIDPPIRTMRLADGRQLTWQEFGRPDGRPVLYFHGGGSRSIEGGIFHREAVRSGLRLIATNRPGMGGSTLCPGRPIAAYSQDLIELLDTLEVEKVACFGESNGGLASMATAATMSNRIVGAVPINPTLPWFDPIARQVTSRGAAVAYWALRHLPGLMVRLVPQSSDKMRQRREQAPRREGFDPLDLVGPPPGTEADVAEIHWRMTEKNRIGLLAEIKWGGSDWGFDPYSIPVPLDFYCGVHDAQAPFALVLADRNPNARFHYFRFGHNGFSHPDARRRIVQTIVGYWEGT